MCQTFTMRRVERFDKDCCSAHQLVLLVLVTAE